MLLTKSSSQFVASMPPLTALVPTSALLEEVLSIEK